MYNVSALFKQYCSQSDREFNVKASVNGVDYLNTSVVEFDIEDSIIPSEDFTIGTVITSRLTIKIRTSDTIATNAKIQPFVQMNGTSGVTEWMPLGAFYIDTRSYQNGVWTFVCYDKLILSQQTYVSSLTYPVSMESVWNEICLQLNYTSDSSVKINSSYEVPYKDEDITIHDMIGYIASAHGASVRMTKDEKVAWVSFSTNPTRTSLAASDYFTEHETNPLKTYTSLTLTYNTDGETLTSGSGDADHTLSFYNPYMTQAMLDALLPMLNGFSYMPFAMNWRGCPYLEIGDSLTVTRRDGTTFPTIILTNKASYKGGLKVNSTAPSYSPQRSETDYKGSIWQQIRAANSGNVKTDTPYYGVTIGRANGIKVEKSDGSGKLLLNSDTIEMDGAGGTPVFKLDATGILQIAAAVHMLQGSTIDWNTVTPPTASQVGAVSLVDLQNDLQNYITTGNLSDTLKNYMTHGDFTTQIGQDYIVTGKIAAEQIAAGTITGILIKAGTIIGDDNDAILNVGLTGGSINTGVDQTPNVADRAAMRLVPGTLSGTNHGYMQVLEDGSIYFYDGSGNEFAYIHPDGSTNLSSSGGGGAAEFDYTIIDITWEFEGFDAEEVYLTKV